ncbi:MAG TPA: diaminopimelate epimerase [Acidimicrobiales bacterium]|nr:diaminopimelate epimerase [Acidimicrobiales bacterium]
MAGERLGLRKHHGAGNDFLVLLDPDGARPVSGAEARALCDRHRGVGGDGLLRATRPAPGTLVMELYNADGSVAEMSGNGIRCFVQAAVQTGLAAPGLVEVVTAAGRRSVTYEAGEEPGSGVAAVGMGAARVGEEIALDELPGARARLVDMGNPHVVILGDAVDGATLARVGPVVSARRPAGANVEFVWPGPGARELSMRVWERGVGETLACGTGACAVAAAAATWGLGQATTRVHSPGGVLEVTLGADEIVLRGPTRHVADVVVSEAVLAAMVADAGRGVDERAGAVGAPAGAAARAAVEVPARP